MGTEGRRTDPDLKDLLFRRPHTFRFFQAVRLLMRLYPDRAPVGADAQPSHEAVRLQVRQSMEFPASEVWAIEEPESESRPAKMTVSFMGLTGPLGVLPWHYTELMIKLQLEKNPALAEFFDLFNHRMISLFYRAWEKHHFFVSYERRGHVVGVAENDDFTQYLFDLVGMGTAGLRGRLCFSDQSLLRYAGLIAQRPHSASALRGILQDYFRIPVEVKQFCGKWFPLDSATLTQLGGEGAHNQLGVGAIAGDAIWNQQAKIQIRLGPMSRLEFKSFLPDGAGFRAVVDWVRFFVGVAMEFEVQPVLKAAETPRCRLLEDDPEAGRLGWMSWLKTDDLADDAKDAVFTAMEVARA